MGKNALVIIDIQNDTPKNYKEVIDNINKSIDWAVNNKLQIIYIRHENLSEGAKLFKHNTEGSKLASDLKIVSKNIFTKYKGSALTCEEFVNFINKNKIDEFYIAGGDATICVKSTCFNLRKSDYEVTVLSDCITSWSMKKIPEMIEYYKSKGCKIIGLNDLPR
ncbi:MAG: cysteine hydrolase [Candidatus Thermoplasmatota archaeon]|nr:cysteine hydrolase [Candidatus Thermoplasmatota archaeon]